MGELYLRKVIVEIYPANGQGKKIENLRVKFRCEKNNESHPNNAEIEIFNLSKETRSMLEGKGVRVALSIGYLGLDSGKQNQPGPKSNVEVVFVGDVSKTVHKKPSHKEGHDKSDKGPVVDKREGQDIITKIHVADGENKFRNARLDKGYPPNTKLKQVFTDVINTLELGKGAQIGIPDVTIANGLTLSGLSRDHLNTLTEAHKLEWSIQDETLQVIPQNKGTTESVVLITPDSGLVGIPEKTDKGVEFKSLIQPKLRPGRLVKVKSRDVDGTFKIRKVTHQGDSNKGTFLSQVEATKE